MMMAAYRCENSILEGNKKLIAAIGLKDIVIVDTEDATLVCDKEHTGDIKKILEQLREQKREEYL